MGAIRIRRLPALPRELDRRHAIDLRRHGLGPAGRAQPEPLGHPLLGPRHRRLLAQRRSGRSHSRAVHPLGPVRPALLARSVSTAPARASRGPTASRRWPSCASSPACAIASCPISTPWPTRRARPGMPVVRPLFLEYPDDPNAYHDELEYMLGPYLLVAPVFNPEGRCRYYLPPGPWYDFWSDERLEGPAHRRVTVPLDRIPLFVRGDSDPAARAGHGLRGREAVGAHPARRAAGGAGRPSRSPAQTAWWTCGPSAAGTLSSWR